MKKNIGILLPAYNEESSIIQTIEEYSFFFPDADIVVVDNNSTDSTQLLVKNYQINKQNVKLLLESVQGKGAAVRRAFKTYEYDWWVMADADSTYPADSMKGLFDKVQEAKVDHGILDRLTTSSYINKNRFKTLLHKFGNVLFTNISRFLSGIAYKDVLSGGRVFSAPFVKTLVINSNGFQIETEINFHQADILSDYLEMPASYRSRVSGSNSKLRPFGDGYKILNAMLLMYLKRRPETVCILLGTILLLPGIIIGMRLVRIFLDNGVMVYSSSAVACAMFIISSLILFGISFVAFVIRKYYQNDLRVNFNQLRLKWLENLQSC